MAELAWWLVGGVAVALAAGGGFLVGRNTGGQHRRLQEIEAELARRNQEMADLRAEVESHFGRSATLFASLADGYRDLFKHLSSGYEKLAGGSARELFRGRVDTTLLAGATGSADMTPDRAAVHGGTAADGATEEAAVQVAPGSADATDGGAPPSDPSAPRDAPTRG